MSATTTTQITASIRVVGGLLPADMITRIMTGKDVSASTPADYHVVGVRSVKDAAERHWDYLKGAWRVLRDAIGYGSDPRGLAIENWLLPLFDEHGYGRLTRLHAGITADDAAKIFPVSHAWQHLPIHLVPWGQDLDKRPADGGLPPQSMVQECLNRTAGHLWGIISNGSVLRLLRDTTSLTGAAYLEVDLAAMFDGELFEDFVLLYRLMHVSRFEVADGAPVSSCRMERWRAEAIEVGTRFLEDIRDGVRDAVIALGTGFLKHPANVAFRENLDKDQAKRALLRLVYRLLFWFVAEDRDALHAPGTGEKTRRRYAAYFSARRLRDVSLRGAGTAHGDMWQAVRLILSGLGAEGGLQHLGLPGLGGIYDDTPTDAVLAGLELSNEQLLTAVKSLSRVRDKSTNRWRRIDYRNLGAEELGAIYESLLELVPDRDGPYTFVLRDAAGNDRKSTGSYYTPTSLIGCLLDSTLDPVLDDATKQAEIAATAAGTDASAAIAEALLSVTVCDPACGSGHFLVAAARRIAKRVAAVREHNPEPTLESLRAALRDVIARCVYGVDVNEMAVELAKVSLWLEALDPGKPLSFLDAHIKCGNALIGATPKLIEGGIPAGAFKPVEGDDPKFAKSLERANAAQPVLTAGQRRVARFAAPPPLPGLEPQSYQEELFNDEIIFSQSNAALAAGLARIAHLPDGSLGEVHRQAAAYQDWEESAENRAKRLVADAWCAAFVWIKREDAPPAIVNRVFTALKEKGGSALPPPTATEIERLREEYSFFHWHLEFPGIFHVEDDNPHADPDTGWSGGFSCVLANPPWDKVEFKEKEYFSAVDPSIAALAGQARRNRITEWEKEHPDEAIRYRIARREVKEVFMFAGNSGAFPLCANGLSEPGVVSLQTDHLFAEKFSVLGDPAGRVGCIIPTTIATNAGAQYLFGGFSRRAAIASLYDFDNRKPLFPTVDSRYKFCLLSLAGRDTREPVARFAFFLFDVADLDELDRVFILGPEELSLLNPNTHTLPIFRNRRNAVITASIYRNIPILWDEARRDGNPWMITFKHLFNMTDDSDLFRTRDALDREGWRLRGNVFTKDGKRMLPLYEAKMTHHFDHRWASFDNGNTDDPRRFVVAEKQNQTAQVQPRYWVAESGPIETRRKGREVRVPGVSELIDELKWEHGWLCGWRDVCRATDERTAIPALIPRTAVGNKFHLMFPGVSSALTSALIATQSSLIFDFVSRQKIGSIAMGLFIWKQLPVPTPTMLEPHLDFVTPRVLELVYTAYDMTSLARDLGDQGEPFRWDEDRRAQLRAELDAFFFRLYRIDDRDDVDYILETFQTETGGLKHNDIAKYGSYRTKDLVLAEYDRMAAADRAEIPYNSPLTPPPGHGPRHQARDDLHPGA
jgi:N-6 DNA Methylase